MRILVTGATGFIGSALLPALRDDGHSVVAVVRRPNQLPTLGESLLVSELNEITSSQFGAFDAIIHLAGHAHRKAEHPGIHHEVNCEVTLSLAQRASEAGLKRFIYLSSAKVHGESSKTPISSNSPYVATDDYSASKIAAEIGLSELASPMVVVSLRSPLVYGPSARGNVAALARLASRGLPLIVPTQPNRRSFISLDNVTSAILAARAISTPGFHGFVLSDPTQRSAEDLFRLLHPQGRVVRLPLWSLRMVDEVARRINGRRILSPLIDDFWFECDDFKEATGWRAK